MTFEVGLLEQQMSREPIIHVQFANIIPATVKANNNLLNGHISIPILVKEIREVFCNKVILSNQDVFSISLIGLVTSDSDVSSANGIVLAVTCACPVS